MRRACAALATLLVWGCGLSVVGTASRDERDGDAGVRPDVRVDGVAALDAIDAVDALDAGDTRVTSSAGNALAFDASSDQYVEFANIPLPSDFTVEAWIRPASSGREMMVTAEDWRLKTADQFRLALLSTGELYFAMSDQSSNYYGLMDYHKPGPETAQFALHSPSPLPVGAWSHVAATKSGVDFALLVDAKIVSSFKAAGATFSRTADWNFRIGARMGFSGPENYFDGLIDEVRIYTRARSPNEISADMSTELVASSPGFADLLSYWRFDEDGGVTAHDDKKVYDGTLKNGPQWVPSDAF